MLFNIIFEVHEIVCEDYMSETQRRVILTTLECTCNVADVFPCEAMENVD